MSVEFDRKKYSLKEYRIFWEIETGKISELDVPLLGLKINDLMNRLQICEQIKGLDKLTQLQYLSINSSNIREISGLNNLTNLQYLSIRGGGGYMKPKVRLSSISGLETLKALKVLRIYDHRLTEITGLENLMNLQELDLRHNNIIKIKGLENLKRLQNLYLGANQITKIEGLQDLNELKCLNLGDNPIYEWAKSKFGGVTRYRSDQYIPLFKQPQALVEYCKSLTKK